LTIIESELSRGPKKEESMTVKELEEFSDRALKQGTTSEQLQSHPEDLRSSPTGTTAGPLTPILSLVALKLEKMITYYDVLPVYVSTMERLKFKADTSPRPFKLSVTLSLEPMDSSEEILVSELESQQPSQEYEKSSSKQEQMELDIPISTTE